VPKEINLDFRKYFRRRVLEIFSVQEWYDVISLMERHGQFYKAQRLRVLLQSIGEEGFRNDE
jgi:hypothetical protein